MSYLVLARKYRPQNFDEVVGQNHLTQTLKSAIQQGKVAHAYLFSGPRGVGKTSAARILAKAINCENGVSANPCQKCTNCQEITQGSSLDVLEIDGASNRGIDEVRALRENVKFSPVRSRFKVYIIDEVHSLTHDAFNALLKTLEEPPAHVKFIFATTESHRVLPTILSRCQRFDFRRIPTALLVKKLSEIAKAEKIEIDTESLDEIALAAGGGLRDAQTILDQLSAYTAKKIQKETVREVLGIIEQEVLARFIELIKQRNAVELLTWVKQLEDRGADLGVVVNHLTGYCRNLLMCQVGVKDLEEVLDLSMETIKKIQQQASQISKEETVLILHTLVEVGQQMKRAAFPKVILELALIRMTEMGEWLKIPELIEHLKELEGKIGDTANARIAPVPESLVPEAAQQTKSMSLAQVSQVWVSVIEKIKSQKIPLGSALQIARPVALQGRRLTIAFPNGENFHKEISERTNNKKLLEQELQTSLGVPLLVEMVIQSGNAQDSSKKEPGTFASHKKIEPSPATTMDHPLVQSALEIFGGRVIHVHENEPLKGEEP